MKTALLLIFTIFLCISCGDEDGALECINKDRLCKLDKTKICVKAVVSIKNLVSVKGAPGAAEPGATIRAINQYKEFEDTKVESDGSFKITSTKITIKDEKKLSIWIANKCCKQTRQNILIKKDCKGVIGF